MILGLMVDAGLVDPDQVSPAAGKGADDPAPSALDAWEFHDLLFHARTRRGRTDAPFGGTYRLAGRMDPPPPVRPVPGDVALPLFRPDLARLEVEDPPLLRVAEARRSERVYGDRPLAARQLGEFLYRVARVRHEQEVELETPRGPLRMSMVARPYPSGGALYELEFYAAVSACEGIEAGLHYYEPRGHALIPLCGLTAEVEGLLRDAAESAGIPRESVQVLLIVSARLPRVSWKYASMAYSLVLKHVGVVFHSMYLAATAMGLAPCALGAGDSDLFARAAGIDYYAETSVGEFLLGSRPATESIAR
jgi:SagB-type dehydrogenase family enzyme